MNGKVLLWLSFVLFRFEKQYTEKNAQLLQRICSSYTKLFVAQCIQIHLDLPTLPFQSCSHHTLAHSFLFPPMTQTLSLPSLTSQPLPSCPQILRMVLSSRQGLIFSGTVSLINPPPLIQLPQPIPLSQSYFCDHCFYLHLFSV